MVTGMLIASGLLLLASTLYGPTAPPGVNWLVVRASPILWPTSGFIPGGHPTRREIVTSIVLAIGSNGLVYALIGAAVSAVVQLYAKLRT